jgi:hypothetical protein
LLREKHSSGFLGELGSHQSFQQRRGFRPQRTTAPLVSFAVQPDIVGLIDIDVRVPKISGFLNASAGIVEEHQERRSRNAMLPSVGRVRKSASTSSRSK